ncbi:MAG: exopolyphosphatase [Wenzhouxiangellaceae bacterium]
MPHRNLYAAVDLGSNSFHLLIARLEQGQLRVIDRLREMVRLGGGLDARGRLDPATRDRALQCLARFGQRLAGVPPGHVRAVGTQTFRRLSHPQAFLIVAETALGFPIDVISGREEARLIWLGVTGATGQRDETRLVIDIGGGSTEIAAGSAREPTLTESLQYGCVSVTRAAFGSGRITAKRWRRAQSGIAAELQALREPLERLQWRRAIGSSGTIRAVQSMIAAAQPGADSRIHREQVTALAAQLMAAGRIERIRLPGLSADRQPVIAGGVLVLETVMQTFAIDELEVSPWALREGLLEDLLGRELHTDPRRQTVAAMAARFGCDMQQARRVHTLVQSGLGQIGAHFGLTEAHAELLEWACHLHEAGLAIAHSHYQVHSAYLVEHADMAGFTRQEQQLLAVLLAGQRRKLRAAMLDALPERLARVARPMLLLIRLAVLFARSRTDADLPEFGLDIEDGHRVVLRLRPGWLAAHPLTAYGLGLERRHLRALGFRLRIDENFSATGP